MLFRLMKNPCCTGRLGRRAVGMRAKGFYEVRARNQSERRRRLGLASGFRLLRSSGIDRLDALAHGAVRGSVGPDG